MKRIFYFILVCIIFIAVTFIMSPVANAHYSLTAGNPTPPSGTPQQLSQNTQVVIIKNNQFQPSSITVAPGTTVTWVNQDNMPHTVTATAQVSIDHFDSGNIAPGKTYTKTFNSPGTYNYYCKLHPEMKGSITVSGGTQTPPNQGQQPPSQGSQTGQYYQMPATPYSISYPSTTYYYPYVSYPSSYYIYYPYTYYTYWYYPYTYYTYYPYMSYPYTTCYYYYCNMPYGSEGMGGQQGGTNPNYYMPQQPQGGYPQQPQQGQQQPSQGQPPLQNQQPQGQSQMKFY